MVPSKQASIQAAIDSSRDWEELRMQNRGGGHRISSEALRERAELCRGEENDEVLPCVVAEQGVQKRKDYALQEGRNHDGRKRDVSIRRIPNP